MLLVFGGTTEGRKAVEVLEEGTGTYYYSTKTGEQDVVLPPIPLPKYSIRQ